MATSVFRSNLLQRYRATLVFRNKIYGGVPNDPNLVRGWLQAAAGITQEDELKRLVAQTLEERNGGEAGNEADWPTYADIEQVASQEALTKIQGFKRDKDGLYLESRQIKAGIKEATNILYAEDRWGPTRKGPKSFLAERVFVTPERVYLGRDKADGIDTLIGHVNSPQGRKSMLAQVEYVDQAEITFDVLVTRDAIKPEWWAEIWTQLQEIGLGAVRSQSWGTFDVTSWERISETDDAPKPPRKSRASA